MNSNPHHPQAGAATYSGEETLRLIAGLPAPEGLEERVHQALREAPHKGQLVAWPAKVHSRVSLRSNSMRTAAAAAIVFVVVGGGWGIYSRVQSGPAGRVIVMPVPVTNSGGFSGAGAIRTPQTLPGPTVGNPGTKATTERKSGTGTMTSVSKQDRSAQPAVSQPATGQHSVRLPVMKTAVAQ